jgi:hypothetical protein
VSALVLERFDAAAVRRFLDEAGVFAQIGSRGFERTQVSIDGTRVTPPCIRLSAEKDAAVHLLFEGRLTRIEIAREEFPAGSRPARSISLVEIFWARQQDPTRSFTPDRPRLPAQEHPGLGILRQVFDAGVRMARALECDGLGNLPKFPHDALIFQRCLGFSFLDPREQGRLDALCRDLGMLSLRDVSLAVVGGAVSNESAATVSWQPRVQAHAIDPLLADYFRSEGYAKRRAEAASTACYTLDHGRLAAAVATFESGEVVTR